MIQESIFSETILRKGALEISVFHFDATNYALVHNSIPVIVGVVAQNRSSTASSQPVAIRATLESTGHRELAPAVEIEVPSIRPRGGLRGPHAGYLRPSLEATKGRSEAETANFKLQLLGDPGVGIDTIAEEDLREEEELRGAPVDLTEIELQQPFFRVLAENEWFNSPPFFESLASFVQPNSARVYRVLKNASKLLEQQTGDSSLQGYQQGSSRAALIALALFEALKLEHISYINPPASFENTGQRVRSTDEVLNRAFGTCLDLAVTFAAVAEQAGLHPVIILVHGHAIGGIMLSQHSIPDPVMLQPGAIRNLITSNALLAVDATFYRNMSFAEACKRGTTFVMETPVFGLVDIVACRRDGMRPLPTENNLVVNAEDVDSDAQSDSGTATTNWALPDLGKAEDDQVERIVREDHSPERIQRWKQSLLDLTFRNRLLNIKPNQEVLKITLPTDGLAVLDDLVHSGMPLDLAGQDAVSDIRLLQGVESAKDLPDEQLMEELKDGHRLYTSVRESQYRRNLKALARRVRTLTEETGSPNLYLTLGTMVISGNSGNVEAPLFLIPVTLGGGTGQSRFRIAADNALQASPNYCLVEWLRTKHRVEIPSLSEPPVDKSGLDIERALAEISRSLTSHNLPYEVRETAFIGICKFSTYEMWRDLDQSWESFMRAPVFRHLTEKAGTSYDDPYGEESLSDLDVEEGKLVLPIAADGAQMKAVVAAAKGRSFVLEGPPGTGKSQTITNLISHCLLEGRTMLFVAEKQAALNVVKSRLEKVGLAAFALDLHGVNRKPANIRKQLKESIDLRVTYSDHEWKTITDRYRSRLEPLAEYPAKIHTPNALGYSMWTAAATLDECGPGPTLDVDIKVVDDPSVDESTLDDALSVFERLARSGKPKDLPQWGLVGRGATGIDDAELLGNLEKLKQAYTSLPPAVRDALEEFKTTEIGDGPILAAFDPLVDHVTQLHRDDESPSHEVDAAPLRQYADALRRAAAAINTFQQQIFPLRSTIQDQALLGGDFESLTRMAQDINSKVLGKKKRREQFDAAAAALLREGRSLDPSRAPELASNVHAARAHLNGLTQQLNSLLANSELFGRTPLDPGLPEELITQANAFNHRAQSREKRAEFARAYPELRAMVVESKIGYNDLGSLVEFSSAWESLMRTLDATPQQIRTWNYRDSVGELCRSVLSEWIDEVRLSGARQPRKMAEVRKALEQLSQSGLDKAVEQLLSGDIEPVETTLALRRGLAKASIRERSAVFGLGNFDANVRDGDTEEFRSAAAHMRGAAPDAIAAQLLAARPFVADRIEGELAELYRQLTAKRGGLSFRRLMERYGEVIKSIVPCFLVSPASLANFVPADGEPFDLVVFDEASQITVEQAVGAMGRAKSAVIVGDSQQMPPTRFGQSSVDSSDDFDPDENEEIVPSDLESILAECVESGLPRLWLSWHYRSQDESLIAFSNTQYYEGNLSSLPAPGGEPDVGVELRRVDGYFYRKKPGKADAATIPSFRYGIVPDLRTNPVEAEAIVDEIITRTNSPASWGQSIGVVTFNAQQRDLILDALEQCGDPMVAQKLSAAVDPLFVKNLENVQGDERDVILFSTAFSAKAPGEKLPLNFGPLSRTGGEKRLNVAVTRARRKVVVFSSFDPSDIDLTRTSSRGLADLRGYLEAAATHQSRDAQTTRIRNSVRDAIADRLEAEGLEVSREYGMSDFTVDLAIRGTGSKRWECAVLLDSERWADMPTVADREGTPFLLSQLMQWGSVVRVWLPEWYSDPESVIKRILAELRQAQATLAERDKTAHEAELAEQRRMEQTREAAEEHTDDSKNEKVLPTAEDEGVVWEEAHEIKGELGSSAVVDTQLDTTKPDNKVTVAQQAVGATVQTHNSPNETSEGVAALNEQQPQETDIVRARAASASKEVFQQTGDVHLGEASDLENPVATEVMDKIQQRMFDVINVEAPMTEDELARRIGTCFGLKRVSAKKREILLAELPEQMVHTTNGERFVWPENATPGKYRAYRTGSPRALTEIPLEEIANALAVHEARGRRSEEEIYRLTLGAFGLKRLTGPAVERLSRARKVAWTVPLE